LCSHISARCLTSGFLRGFGTMKKLLPSPPPLSFSPWWLLHPKAWHSGIISTNFDSTRLFFKWRVNEAYWRDTGLYRVVNLCLGIIVKSTINCCLQFLAHIHRKLFVNRSISHRKINRFQSLGSINMVINRNQIIFLSHLDEFQLTARLRSILFHEHIIPWRTPQVPNE